jgi:hypothetical protein
MTIREMAEAYGFGESAIKMKLKRIKNKILHHYKSASHKVKKS